MIPLTNEQIEKITLLDKLFDALSVEQLKEISESEQIISRLKGTSTKSDLFTTIIRDNGYLLYEVSIAKTEVMSLKGDMQNLIRAVNMLYQPQTVSYPYSQELTNLKSKHGIY